MQLIKITILTFGLLINFLFSKTVSADEYIQLSGVVPIHTTYRSGRYSIN